MEPYTQRTRQRIIALYDAGNDTAEVAAEVGGCPSGVRRIRQIFEQTGSLVPRHAKPGPKPSLDADALTRLADRVAAKPDATLAELCEFVGVDVGLPVYCKALKKLGLTRKKKALRAAEQDRPDVAAKRELWHALDSNHQWQWFRRGLGREFHPPRRTRRSRGTSRSQLLWPHRPVIR